jgi:hypothetical protein
MLGLAISFILTMGIQLGRLRHLVWANGVVDYMYTSSWPYILKTINMTGKLSHTLGTRKEWRDPAGLGQNIEGTTIGTRMSFRHE